MDFTRILEQGDKLDLVTSTQARLQALRALLSRFCRKLVKSFLLCLSLAVRTRNRRNNFGRQRFKAFLGNLHWELENGSIVESRSPERISEMKALFQALDEVDWANQQ